MKYFTLPKLILLLTVLLISGAADDLDHVRAYIQSRLNGTPLEEKGHCGLRHRLDLRLHYDKLDPLMKAEAAKLLQRPERENMITSPSGYFNLHYDTSGYNAVPSDDISGNGVPDYIDSAMVIFDHVRDVQINQLGFRPPVNIMGNPVENYDVYFTKDYNDYGWTQPEDEVPGSPGTRFTSFIEINSNLFTTNFYTNGFDALRVSAAHEFCHAIQFAYNLRSEGMNYPDLFFLEMTSTWMEDYIYDDVNDYYDYVSELLPNINRTSFTSTQGVAAYGNCVYLHMLEEKYGPKIVPDIWLKIVDEKPIQAVNTVLEKKGWSFSQSQNTYAGWLYFTGDRAIQGNYFPEAQNYPMVNLDEGEENIEKTLYGYRMRLVEVSAEDSLLYKAKLTADNISGLYNHITNNQMPQKAVSFGKEHSFYYEDDTQPVVVVLSNPSDSEIDNISYEVKQHSTFAGSSLIHAKKSGDDLIFHNVPPEAKISIFTLNGRNVDTFRTSSADRGVLHWNMRDLNGSRISSGIYLYVVKDGKSETIGKFAVVR